MTRYLTILKMALRALRRNKLRSGLTSLGVVIGIASVIAMVGIGTGARAQIEARIGDLGQNLIMITPGSSNNGGVRTGAGEALTLTPGDAEAIATDLPPVVGISPELNSRSQVVGGGLNWNTRIYGGSADYLDIRNRAIAAGEMFTEDDVTRVARVAVIGTTVAKQLFGEDSPVGRQLRIGRALFRIIGVLEPKGYNVGNQDQDDLVLIPYTTHMRQVSRRSHLNSILVQIADIRQSQAVQDQIEDLLLDRHEHAIAAEEPFRVRDQAEIIERATAATDTMTALLGSIAAISLLVGGIGIMNIMLVSVTERTREIGIRLALGAHGRDVLRQFLAEAVIVGLFGGVVGGALGIGGGRLLATMQGWPVQTSWPVVWLAIGVSVGIGVVFGYYPARRAANLDPIEALRYE